MTRRILIGNGARLAILNFALLGLYIIVFVVVVSVLPKVPLDLMLALSRLLWISPFLYFPVLLVGWTVFGWQLAKADVETFRVVLTGIIGAIPLFFLACLGYLVVAYIGVTIVVETILGRPQAADMGSTNMMVYGCAGTMSLLAAIACVITVTLTNLFSRRRGRTTKAA